MTMSVNFGLTQIETKRWREDSFFRLQVETMARDAAMQAQFVSAVIESDEGKILESIELK